MNYPLTIKSLFNTDVQDFDIAWEAGQSTLTGVKIQGHFPPALEGSAAICLEFEATALGAVIITPRLEFFVHDDYGTDGYEGVLYNFTNGYTMVSGTAPGAGSKSTVTTDAGNPVYFAANVYAEPWYKTNNGWRIVLSRNDTTEAITSDGSAIFR